MTISTLTLYGAMPYSSTGFFASGIGLVVEALMFSYLLQHRIKLLEADIQRKRQGLLLKNRKAQQGELISAVSHQWKQPLTAISAIIMRLQYRLEDEKQISKDEIKPTLRQINEKIAFLSETLDEFRQFIGTRNSADRSDVTAVVERAVAMSRDELLSANIMIRTEFYFNDNPTVLKTELLHILLNLILNAKEAFESSPSESKTIVINGHGDREQITIDVEDNAGGIAEKHLNHIFDEFYSSKQNQQDRGLGLYLSKYIIEEQMQGSI
ncbi:hypothetical protein BOW53_11170 [Solemya pervernicosa gill symbiont]|uniref:histidine kinase n=2 Tax=Gammaproteobacteria incertae sedis TaxID=118884 RepID=A0A1T2L3G2_9GAMM|nr:HAMP domain-containing sensor histidine kinase [Candidatus Reidiella endopervernicosa]OOZ39540.1 hypothetical protein BOW53_11170 [Solemya pervernicosa gill symbiont]QKQ26787.1 HAMP domain-containing histidine kinase [Candidatus Reidiella endopervernicosa]